MFSEKTFRPRPAGFLWPLAVVVFLTRCVFLPHPCAASETLSSEKATALFAHKLHDVINTRCLACHGDNPEKLKGGLDLRSREHTLKGGDSGPAFVPGSPTKSLLVEAIHWTNEDLQMPPKESERLSEKEVAWFEQWIQANAPWPDDDQRRSVRQTTKDEWSTEVGILVATSGGLKAEWTERKYLPENLWAYQPLSQPEPPSTASHPIDAFITEALQQRQIATASSADRRTLIRRASYGLLGLPPSPEQIKAFELDPRPHDQAFAALIESLLSSPHYGEHWARHWLDVVRYADTAGFANDFDRGNAWRYRDYVVRAFNNDKRYPDFIREQVAGDELAPDSPENLIAVGFLRMGPWELTGMEVPAIARQRFLDDAVNTVGQAFLGHTLRCAKCHDHKFDPIPTRDYYSLYSIFNTTQLTERPAPFLPNENRQGFKERQYLLEQKKTKEQELKDLTKKSAQAVANWFAERGIPHQTREAAQKAGLSPEELPPRRFGFTVEDFGRERIARKTISRLKWQLERYEPIAYSVYTGRSPKRTQYTTPQRVPDAPFHKGELERGQILTGGDAFSPGETVVPASLSVLNELNPELTSVSFPESPKGRRTALADWITHPKNPLTHRAIVNRIWQWHFGQAIAGNPNNLGASGKKPTHPELLDWLAVQFRNTGGSFKAMHRLIMTSAAYQRNTTHPDPETLRQRDPNGTSYAVFRPRRLRSEELRDSLLAVSGELNPSIGGIPNRPEINLEVALQPRMVMGTFATAWQPNPTPQARHRRSLYALKLRGLRDPLMEVFNEPDPDLSCEGRDASNVTPQVFGLFNSQIAYDRAIGFALRVARETDSATGAIERAFELALGRRPTAAELDASREHYAMMLKRHQSIEVPSPHYPINVVREAVEENTGEKFQFTETLGIYRDFQPDPKFADVPPATRALSELCLVLFNSNEFIYIY